MEGHVEGRLQGQRIDRIQALQEFLGLEGSSSGALETGSEAERRSLQEELHTLYEERFKR